VTTTISPGAPGQLDIIVPYSGDLGVSLVFSTGSAYDVGTASIVVYKRGTTQVAAGGPTVAQPTTGTVTLSATPAVLTALAQNGPLAYTLFGVKAGITSELLSGVFSLRDPSDTSYTPTSGTQTVTVNTGAQTVNVAVTVAANTASAVTVTDAGGYYTTTPKTVETVLQDAGLTRTRNLIQPVLLTQVQVMASPPSIGALALSSAIASSVTYSTSSGANNNINTAFFTTSLGSTWTKLGDTNPNFLYVTQQSPTVGTGSTYGRFEFDYYGTAFEINGKGSGGKVRIWVDGALVSTTPTTFTSDGNVYFLPVTFGSVGHRRITIDHYNFAFGGITIGPNDSITPVDKKRPKVLLIGDSFVEGTGASNCDGFPAILGSSLGWDVWAAAQGGSGYSNPGPYTGKYSTRIPFYSALDFDIIITSGGINDANSTYISSLAADAAALFATIKTTWPTAVWICTSPLVNKGVEGWASQYHTARTTLQSAATTAGFYFVDLMSMPIVGSTATAGTLASGASGGATTISSSVRVPNRTTIEIGTGLSTVERRIITNTSGAGPYTLTVAALTNAHNSGEVVTQVGNCLWTGTGRVGATTGSGNCDIFVASDNTHPTQAGHLAIGRTMAALLATALNPLGT